MAGLIKNPVYDVGASSRNTSPGINKNHACVQKRKSHSRVLSAGGFTM
jgi:hypothetical protein